MQLLVDRDGATRTALHILLNEVMSAGVESIGLVIHPGDAENYRAAAGPHSGRLVFIEQESPLGFGHAVACAHDFTGNEAFLLMMGDHLYVSAAAATCAQQLVALAEKEKCAVSAVEATHESKLPLYGTIGGVRVAGQQRLYEIRRVREKPTPTEAEQNLIVPGLRAGYYLCFFGMHILPASLMERIEADWKSASEEELPLQLSPALDELARGERYLAHELEGTRYDIGLEFGLMKAQVALGLSGADRDLVLNHLIELLAAHRGDRKL